MTVELSIAGAPIRASRTGSDDSNLLEWHGPEGVLRGLDAEKRLAEAFLGSGQPGLGDVFLHTALLQQDAVRSLLEAEPKQRFLFLASLMGIDDLSRFTDAAKRRSDAVGRQANEQRQQYEATRTELERLRAREAQLRDQVISEERLTTIRGMIDVAESEVGELVTISKSALLDASAAVAAARELAQLASLCHHLSREHAQIADAESKQRTHTPDELIKVADATTVLEARLVQARLAEAEARAAVETERQRRGDFVRLASLALPLLGERCPVCEQAIETHSVADHLRQVIEQQPGLMEVEAAANEAAAGLAALGQEMDELREREREVRDSSEAAAGVTVARAEWRARVDAASAWTDLAVPGLASVTGADADTLRAVQEAAEQLRLPLQQLARALESSNSARQLAQVAAEIRVVEQRLAESQELATRQSQRSESAKTLLAAAARGAASVAERRLSRVQPQVDEIFARLDPHPAFTRLEVRLDDYYRKGVAETITRDEAENVEADPLLVFSSSQANVAALTWFLALSWSAGSSALPFLLLDDPLQSLDNVNILGFADLCRRLRDERQLIVSTHEPRLARLLERKLSARTGAARTVHIRFGGWDRSGPTVTWEDVPDQHAEGQLRLVG